MIQYEKYLNWRKTKKKALHEALRVRILTLDLPPGTGMDEALLEEFYGVSRTPRREVFHRLAGEGFMTLNPIAGRRCHQ